MTTKASNGTRRHIALVMGPVAGGVVFALCKAGALDPAAAQVAGIATVMAIWWMTEALPLAVTALVPVAVFPVLGIISIDAFGASYAHPLVFLFLGGFLIGRAMQCRGLSRALALFVLSRIGSEPRIALAGLIGTTAFLSLWISNTASAMIMVPIAVAVASRYDGVEFEGTKMTTMMVLGVAYAATIGGMGTLIGTPPNALFAAFMTDAYGVDIGFARWLLVGLPVVVVLLPVMWLVLSGLFLPASGARSVKATIAQPAVTPAMRRVGAIAGLAAIAWLTRPALVAMWPDLGLNDGGIAIIAAILLFVVPSGKGDGRALLSWKEAAGIRWDVLILFGGGLALAYGIDSSGLSQAVGGFAAQLDMLPLFLLVVAMAVVVVLLGELASNTAMAAMLLPIAGATIIGLGGAPTEFLVPLVLATSVGFMLPVATPPNAIAFGSGNVGMTDMVRVGAILDAVGLAIVIPLGFLFGSWVFG